ncbi:tandem-95 repeat protein [Endozoicomonadaceae bacterium StTr2]
MSEGQDQGHNQINGSEDGENINGTTGNDFIQGNGGDDTIRGGAGADIIDGGAGSDRIVFTDTDSVDTIHFTQSGSQSDIIDVSALVPADVTAATLKNYVKINANGIYIDTEGQGQFSSGSQVARFASGNPPLSVMSAIQVAATNSVIDFNWTETANIPLVDAHDYIADSVGNENTISGTAQADNIQGTAAADTILGKTGNDTIDGGAGADYLDGGAGSDRYVLSTTDAVDTIKAKVTNGQQDSIDISHLLPAGTVITAENVESFVQVTEDAVFVDPTGQGNFSESNKVAEFAEDSVFDSHTITVHVAENTALVLDVVPSVGVQLGDGESFASEQLLSQTLDTPAAGAGLGNGAGILRSSRGQKFNLRLDEHNLTEAYGGAGDEQLDATSIAARNAGQSASEADYAVKLYGRDGNDTLVGNDDGGVLDGGAGSDRIEAGKGRNLLIGGEGEDEFALTLESSAAEIKSDKLYDFSSREGNRDLLDLKDVLPAEATAQNIHSYVKVTGKGIFVDVSGQGQFNEESQLARFGERVDIDDLINIRLNDGTNIQLDRSGAISTVQGEADSDLVQAGEGSDTLYGNAGDDTLDGDGLGKTKSADHLFGGEGNDKIIADKLDFTDGTVDGGVGFDRVYINEDEGQSVSVDLHASGVERVDGGDSNDVLDGSGYTDSSGGYNKETGAYETAEAQRLDLYGRGGKDTLIGGVGRDYLDGGVGDDSLSGGQGRDFMTGGSGNDTFVLADDDELDVVWDFTSSGDQYDVIDISAFTSDNFDYNSLPDYFSIDDDYIYFDKTGTGTFTENEAIAKLGGGTTIDNDYIKVEVDGTRIGYNPTSKSVVYVNSNDPDAAATGSTVAEDSGENTVVGQVSYTDQDGVEPITYSIAGGNDDGYFAIDSSTGQVTLTAVGEAGIDYETATSHTLQVMATDRDFSSTPVNLVVNLADINDEAPNVSLSSNVVNENSPEGTVLGQVTGADPDTTGETLSYAISSGNDDGYFAIDSSTGQVTLTAAGSANFDYETATSHTVYVTASDGTNTSTPLPLTFQLNDINEGPEVSGAVSVDATEDLSFTLTKADLLENASDVDGDSLSVSNVAVASGQVNVTDNGDDTWTVTPQSNWSGNSQITFTVSDGSLTTSAQADITVAAAADAPVLTIGGSTQISHTNFNSGLAAGWTSENSVETHGSGGPLGSSPSGTRVAELDAETGTPDAYYYTIDTSQGNDHEVSLMVKQRGNYDGTDEIEVVWNGEVIQTIDPGTSWQEVKVTLPDIGLNNTQLIIREVAGQDNGVGPLLDQITVNRIGAVDSESDDYDKVISNREDTVFTLDLSASLSDNDGSETLAVTLGGIPSGFSISDGSNTATTDGSDVDVSDWNLSALTFTPVANHDTDFNMTVTAASTDGADTASTSHIIRVDMQPVADTATVTGDDSGSVYEDAGSTLTKSGSLVVNDGDAGEQSFVAETINGTYGSVTIDNNGDWVYSADNSQNAIQSLSQSQTLSLNGSLDDYVRIESDIVPSDDFTISLWVKPDLVDSDFHGFLGSEPNGVSSRSPSMYVYEDGSLHWSSFGTDNVSHSGVANNVFTQGEWSHITWVKEGTEFRFYKDGALIHTDTAPTDVKLTGFTNLGRVDNAFDGELDDIQTYDRALSASEISSAMSGETQPGLFAHYDFAGYSLSQALEDRAGNHPDGAVNGSMSDADLGKRVDTLTDTLTVRTADGTTHDIDITIHGRNDGPAVTVASPTVSVSTDEDVNLVLTRAELLANVTDADDADSLSISDIVVELGDASFTDNHDGTWTLTPAANWAGTGKFSYTVSDGDKLLRVKGDFAVDSVADTPVVTFAEGDNPTFTINEDEAVPLNMTAEFGDLDGSETYSLVISNIPAGVTIGDGSNSVSVTDGTLDVTGWQYSSITVTPPANSGTDFDLTLTATATESNGEQSTVTRTVSVDITGQNDAPVVSIEARGAETPVQLNTATTGDQEGIELAVRPNGGYVAVWTDKSQGSEGQIIGRLYDKDGVAESAEFRVDTSSVKTGSANVAVHDDGSFVVAWSDTNAGGRGQIEVQRFDASGSPVSSNSTAMTGNLHNPDVITLSNGDYVVSAYDSWHGSRTEMQVFNSSGAAKSGVITTGSIGRHAGDVDSVLNALNDGNWANTVRNNRTDQVKVSVYDDTGTAVGSDSFTASEPGLAVTTLSDGGMAVVYSDAGTIKLRSLDNNGQLNGSEVDLGQTSAGEIAVTQLTDGTLFISWNEADGLYGQRFLADGTEAGGKTTLTTEASASDVSIVELDDGSLQLAWHSEGVDGNGHAVVASNLIVPVDDLANGTVIATANAVDGDQDALTYSLTNDAGGRYAIDSSTGEITVADSSLIDFAVSPSHTITVAVNDGTVTTTVDYTIYNNNNNLAPDAADSSVSAREDISYVFTEDDFPIVDPNSNDYISEIRIESLPDTGSLTLNSAAVGIGDVIDVSDIQAGNLQYLSNNNENGADYTSFTFNVADRLGLYSSTEKTLTIDVSPENDAPVVVNAIGDQSVAEDSSLSYQVPVNTFTDIDGDSLSYSASLADGSNLPDWLSFDASSRTFSGVPDNDNVGTLSLKVTATDPGGMETSAQFNLDVTNVNDGPLQVFQESGGVLSIEAEHFHSSVARSGNEWEVQSNGSASGGEQVVIPDNVGGYAGSTEGNSPELTYEIQVDSPGTYYVWVLGSADGGNSDSVHVGLNGNYLSSSDGVTGFGSGGNWSSGTMDSGKAYIEITETGRHQLNLWMREDGFRADKVLLTKDSNYTPTGDGPDESGYFNAPVDQTVAEESAFSYTLSADTFVDMDAGDTLSYSASMPDGSALPDWLSFDAATRTFSGTPDDADIGNITVKVTASDGEASQSDEFVLTVTAVNDTPDSIALDSLNIAENSAGGVVGNLSTTDVDAGDSHTYTVSDNRFEVSGSQLKLKDGISLDHETEGTVSVTLTSTDSAGASVDQQFTLNVTDANDAPIASSPVTKTANEDNSFTLTEAELLANTTDADNDTLSVSNVAVNSGQMSVTDNSDGTWTVVPDSNWAGNGQLTFNISDGTATISSQVDLTVTAVADSPVLSISDSTTLSTMDFESGALASGWSSENAPEINDASVYGVTDASGGNGKILDLDDNEGSAGSNIDALRYTVDTSEGFDHELTFHTRTRADTEGTDTFEVVWNGAVIQTVEPGAAWENITIRLPANGQESGQLEIREISSAGAFDDHGALFDDIKINKLSAITINEDQSATFDLSVDTVDTDGSENITLSLAGLPSGYSLADGSNTVTSTGGAIDVSGWNLEQLQLTPAANAETDFTITLTATSTETSNSDAAVTTQTISVDVVPVQDAAVISGDDTGDVTEDGASILTTSGTLSVSDVDAADTGFTAETVSGSYGSVAIDADGNWTYSADNSQSAIQSLASGETLTESINVRSADGTQHTIEITVTGTDDAPVAAGVDLGSVVEDGSFSITQAMLLANSSDIDGDSLSVTSLTLDNNAQGSVTDNGNGTWTFTPAANLSVEDVALSFVVSDGSSGDEATATATIDVTGVVDAPAVSFANADSYPTSEVTLFQNGAVATNNMMGWSGSGSLSNVGDSRSSTNKALGIGPGASISRTIDTSDDAVDSFTFQVEGRIYGNMEVVWGGEVVGTMTTNWNNFSTRTFNLTATGDDSTELVLRYPSGSGQNYSAYITAPKLVANVTDNDNPQHNTDEDSAVAINLSAALTDQDGSETLGVVLNGIPAGATISDGTNSELVSGGSLDVSGWNYASLSVLPPANSHADFDLSLAVTATEAGGDTSTVNKTISVQVAAVDDAPIAGNIDLGSTAEDTSVVITQAQLLASASDIDGDSLSVTSVSIGNGAHGTVTDNGNGTWTYTPAADYNGTDVEFSFTVSDGSSGDEATATATIDVTAVDDDAVVANPIGNQSVNEDSALSFTVPENTFTHADGDALTYTASQGDGSALPDWLSFDAATRTFSGTPDNEDVATLSLKVTAADADGETTDASFNLVVNNVNDNPAPVFAESNGLVSIEAENFSSSVARSGNSWSVESDGSASGGKQVNTANNDADGFNEGYTGLSSELTYDIQFDSAGTYYVWLRGEAPDGRSDSAHIGLNGEAIATGHRVDFEAGSGHQWTGDRMENDGRITIEVDAPGVHQLNLWMREDGAAVDKIVISDNADYVPTGNGPAESDYVGLSDQTTAEESAFSYTIDSNAFRDIDGDSLTYSATLANGDPLPNWLSFDAGTRTFSGTPDDPDLGTIQVKVTASDGSSSASADFGITVTGVNDAPATPEAVIDQIDFVWGGTSISNKNAASYDLPEGFELGDSVWLTKTDGGYGKGVKIQISDNGDGTVNIKVVEAKYTDLGTWNNLSAEQKTTYFEGAGTQQLVATSNSSGGYGISEISVDGGPVTSGFLDTSSGINIDPFSTVENSANGTIVGTVAASDVEGDNLTYSLTDNAGGRFSINSSTGEVSVADGSLLDYESATSHTITVQVSDGQASSTRDYTVQLKDTNDVPELVSAVSDQTTAEEASFSYTIPAFTDEDGDVVTLTASLTDGSPLPAWLSFDADTRTFSGTPDDADLGVVQVRVTANDGSASTTADISITVTSVNDTPVANADVLAINEGQTLSLDVLANDTDADAGDSLSLDAVQIVDGNGNPVSGKGVVSIVDGKLEFDTNNDFDSLASGDTEEVIVRYTASDAAGAQSVANVTVTVTGQNDAAVISSVVTETEDFNSLNTGNLNGQDGWVTEQSSAVPMEVTNSGQDGSSALHFNQVSASVSASKVNTIPDLSNAGMFAFEVDMGKNWWGTQVGIGGDNNDDGKIGRNDSELAIAVRASDHNDQLQLLLADGSTRTVAFPAADGGGWARYRIEIDLAGNNGEGSVTVKYKDLSAGDSSWSTVSGLENINAGLDSAAANHTNPNNWDGVFIQGDGQGVRVDNLTLETRGSQTSVSVTEDADLSGNNLVKTGLLVATDADAGESSFNAETLSGTYGSLTIDSSGNWNYTADNTQAAIQSLGNDDQLTDTITVSTADGTTHDITVTINGVNDAPELTELPMFDSVVAAYNFSDGSGNTAADTSGNGNDISLSGSAGFGTGHNGSGTAFEMNGSSGGGDLGNISTGGEMTISTWVKFDSFSQSWSRIVDFGNGSADNNIILAHEGTTNTIAFEIYDGTGYPADGVLKIDNFFTQGEWVHITATVDSSGAMRIYKNGELAGENLDGAVPPEMTRSNNYVGKSNWSNDGALDGSVDELSIFNSTLNASEVKALYQAGGVDNMLGDALHIAENSANTASVGTVAASDTDGDNLTYSLTDNAGGRFAINSSTGEITVADGSLLDHEAAGSHSVTVQVSDGYLTDSRSYTIYVTNVNDAPDSSDATVTAGEDAALTLTAANFSFSDEDSGDALEAVVITTLPAEGTLTLNGAAVTANQSISKADIDAGLLKYTPAENVSGNARTTFNFKVSDGDAVSDNDYTITVNVTPDADAPVISIADSTTVSSMDFESGSLASGWSSENTPEINNASVYGVTDSSGGDGRILDLDDDDGAAANNLDALRYTIDTSEGFDHEVSFKLRSRPSGENSDTLDVIWNGEVIQTIEPTGSWETVTIRLPAEGGSSGQLELKERSGQNNDYGPLLDDIAINKLSAITVNEDTNATFNLGVDLADTDGSETLAVSLSGIPSGYGLGDGTNSVTSTGAAIDVTGWNLSQLQLTPVANANADFTITVSATSTESVGGDTSTSTQDINVNVVPVNDGPTGADASFTLNEDGSRTITAGDFGFSDIDAGDSLQQVQISTLPGNGSLKLNGVAVTDDQVISKADIDAGLLVFSPDANEAGDNYANVGFKVHDGTEFSASENTLTFNVNALADTPTLNNISTEVLNSNFNGGNQDGWQEHNPYGSGSSAFQNNQLYNWNGREVFRDVDTSDSSVQTYELTFTLYHNKNPYHTSNIWVKWGGQTVATYTESAGSGTVTSTKTIRLQASGDPTTQLRFDQDTMYFKLDNIKINKVIETDEDTALSLPDLGLALVDTDGSETLTAEVTGAPAGAVLTDGTNTVTSNGSAIDISGWNSAALQITPPADSSDDINLTFTATSTDSNGDTATTSESMSITVNAVNDKPITEDGNLMLRQGDSYSFDANDFKFTDVDSGDSMQSITITTLPASGSLTLNGAAVTANQVISLADIDKLKYTAPATEADVGTSFGFTVSDGSLSSDAQSFALNVRGTLSDNLLTNASAQNGTSGWNIVANGGSGWGIEGTSHDGDGKSWGTSYQWNKKSQTIDLLAKGFTEEFLDSAPEINVSDWFRNDHSNDSYFLKVQLKDASGNTIASFDSGTLTATSSWQEASKVFSNYGEGVRSIYFEHGGKDSEYWGGQYGARIDDSEVVIKVGDVELKGTANDDIIQGSERADTIKGEAGSDTLLGDDGADLIFGGAGDDTIKGDDGQPVAVNLDAAFISSASAVTLPAATGLKAEVFDTSTVFSNLDQAISLVTNNNPKATFTASELNYHRSGSYKLADFIGSDGNDITGHADMSDQTFALKMTGYIRLSAGTHDFNVASDDGFRLKINNETVTEFTAPRGVATSSGNFTAPQDGLYEVELIYWQGNGGADLDITSSTAEPFQFYDMLPAGAELVTGQDYYDLPTPDVTVDVANGVSLSAGTNNGDGTWTLKGSDLNGLTMTGSGNNWDDSLTFTANKQTKRSIAIGDSSFESQALGDSSYVHNPASSAWTFSGSNSNGIHDYDGNAFDEQSSEGTDAGFINDDGGTITQTLSENFNINTTYQLQVDIGNRKSVAGLADYEVRIKAGGVVLAADGSVSPAEGQFETLTLNLNGSSIAANSPAVGQPITIELIKISGPQIAFDNVRMTAVTTEQVAQETVNTDQSDQITGGAGDDILSGGNDSDTFIWNSGDLGTAEAPAEDTITDFQAGQGGDTLDLSDVLVDDTEPLEDYLSLNFENGNTTIEVKPDANGGVTQKIKLEGVDLSGYGGGTNDAEILNNLLSDGNLQIDP